MTIDSGWVGVMKKEVPCAFQEKYPFKGQPRLACIDGMPRLMRASGDSDSSWDAFVRKNFARPVEKYFRCGCHVVVLMLDNYDEVPMAKSITQANRSKKHAPYEFGEGSQLPTTIPHGYNECLSNRIFKRKVMSMVCTRIVEFISLPATDAYVRSLVIDYAGCPVRFDAAPSQPRLCTAQPTFLVDVPPMGEADVKFLRWGAYFGGAMIACSVDGDFIPIALMQHEAAVRGREQGEEGGEPGGSQEGGLHGHGCQAPAVAAKPFKVCIYRMKYNPPAANAGAKQQAKAGKPSKAGCGGQAAAAFADGSGAVTAHRLRNPREFEYVDIPALYKGLRACFSGMCRTFRRSSQYDHHYMRVLAVLICLSGTDFTRGLPLVGPATLWDMVQERCVFAPLLQCYSVRSGLVRVGLARGSLVSNIYMKKFASHFKNAGPAAAAAVQQSGAGDRRIDSMLSACVRNSGSSNSRARDRAQAREQQQQQQQMLPVPLACAAGEKGQPQLQDSDDDSAGFCGYTAVLEALRGSSLSDRTKESLPSCKRVDCTFKNVNWVMRYWVCEQPVAAASTPAGEGSGPSNVAGQARWDYSVCYPDPLGGAYGFVRVAGKGKNGKQTAVIKWEDELEAGTDVDEDGGGLATAAECGDAAGMGTGEDVCGVECKGGGGGARRKGSKGGINVNAGARAKKRKRHGEV
jgi:hypothetical protein